MAHRRFDWFTFAPRAVAFRRGLGLATKPHFWPSVLGRVCPIIGTGSLAGSLARSFQPHPANPQAWQSLLIAFAFFISRGIPSIRNNFIRLFCFFPHSQSGWGLIHPWSTAKTQPAAAASSFQTASHRCWLAPHLWQPFVAQSPQFPHPSCLETQQANFQPFAYFGFCIFKSSFTWCRPLVPWGL